MYNIGVGRVVNAKAENNTRDKYHRDRNAGQDRANGRRGIHRNPQGEPKGKKSERYGGKRR